MPDDLDYEQLETTLRDLPAAWYPALLVVLTEAAYAKNVFMPGGVSRLCQAVESRLAKDQDHGDKT